MLDALPPTARLWLFAFDAAVPDALVADVQAFCETWTSHGRPVRAEAEVVSERALAVAAVIREADLNAGVSGCGIDAMQRAVEAAATRHGAALAPALSVTYRDPESGSAGAWRTVGRPEFRRLVTLAEVGPETRVLDLTPTTLGALREAGGAERPAGAAWHAAAFGLQAVA